MKRFLLFLVLLNFVIYPVAPTVQPIAPSNFMPNAADDSLDLLFLQNNLMQAQAAIANQALQNNQQLISRWKSWKYCSVVALIGVVGIGAAIGGISHFKNISQRMTNWQKLESALVGGTMLSTAGGCFYTLLHA